MSSILAGDTPIENAEEPKGGSKFGKLRQNKKARNKRENLRFFDSADWAMNNQPGGQEAENQEDGVLHVSQMPSIVDGAQPQADNTNSTLISEGSGSPLAK